MITTSLQFGLLSEQPANLPIETDLRKRASPLASVAQWRRYTSETPPW
jgi:hypothetical protein